MTKDGKLVVLCVDDDQDVLAQLQLLLEAEGYVVATARSAAACRSCLDEVCADLVLLDMMMESADAGLILARELKARCPTLPIFLLSSAGDGLTQNVAPVMFGIDGVFQKPLQPEQMLAVLARLEGGRNRGAGRPDVGER